MPVEQWVNLPRESQYVEDEISDIKRLDFVRFKVKFKKALLSGYKLEIRKVGGANFENYEANEQKRNINFKVVGLPGVLTNDGATEVTYEYEIYLNAAGDNEYEIVATHKGKEVTSPFTVKSRRKLFYQVMKMQTCPTVSMKRMEDEFWNPGRKHYIKMKKKGAKSTVKLIPCLDDKTDDEFIKESAKGYTLHTHKPYAFGMTFVNYIATPEVLTITKEAKFTPGNPEWTVDLDRYLWWELSPKDDLFNRWYIDIQLWFEPDSNPAAKDIAKIPKSMVEPFGPAKGAYGGRKQIKFNTPDFCFSKGFLKQTAGKWKVQMKLVCVEGFSGGFAYNNINLLAICTKAWWNPSIDGAVQTVIHEVGHKVGMVAHGDKPAYGSTPAEISASAARKNTLPNAPPKLYGDVRGTNDQEHMGSHCAKGATFEVGQGWSGSPGCTMFGADAIGANKTPEGFCSDCSKAVRKLDLSYLTLKLGGFRVSMDDYK